MFWNLIGVMVVQHRECTQCHRSKGRRKHGFGAGSQIWAVSTGLWASDRGLGAGREGARKLQTLKASGPLCPAHLPTPGGILGLSLELFAGAGVPGGGSEYLGSRCLTEAGGALPGLQPHDPGRCPRQHRCACIWGHVSQLPVSELQTCITWGLWCAIPLALTMLASPFVPDGLFTPFCVCACVFVCRRLPWRILSFQFAGLPMWGIGLLFFKGKVLCGQKLC